MHEPAPRSAVPFLSVAALFNAGVAGAMAGFLHNEIAQERYGAAAVSLLFLWVNIFCAIQNAVEFHRAK